MTEKEQEQFEKLQVGDILVSQWGYSMILYDFFQVINKTAKSITIQELQKTAKPTEVFLQSQVWPIKDSFARAAVTRRIGKSGTFRGTLDSQLLHVSSIYDPKEEYIEDHAD